MSQQIPEQCARSLDAAQEHLRRALVALRVARCKAGDAEMAFNIAGVRSRVERELKKLTDEVSR